jgi:hypothetical protein
VLSNVTTSCGRIFTGNATASYYYADDYYYYFHYYYSCSRAPC